ncbi:hypothetical protein NIIDMKKI_19100 [Mycobacterium kansasii]|uniref:Amidohydrolase-related domain-containing protein n=1 Tax=Mycobacterium kansasii TaxID=1768 RepID=A0A7G1I8D9_MYCKA|nr:hypothetical protein NIIDMKKI_19100 [Mycobacterium kansasii]
MIMGHLNYLAIDVDNHYYEPLDAFTRHLDKRFRRRGVQMFSDGRHTQAIIGDRVNRFIPNPTFDPIIVPGCLDVLFRGEIPAGVDPASLMKVEKLELRPEYQHRDVRVAVLESQGIETILVFPTFGCGVEEALRGDIEATMASLHAFNLWLDEDWGFDRPDHRVLAAPMISLADPEEAVREIDFVLARGARLVHVRPAPVPGIPKNRSLGHRSHDPAWARLAEAGVPVAFHLGDSGYLKIAAMWGGKETFEPFAAPPDPLDKILVDDRAIHDTMASLIVHGVSIVIPNSGWPASRTVRNGCIGLRSGSRSWLTSIRARSPMIPSIRCASTCGCHRTTRKISSCWPTRSASIAFCSARTGPTAKVWSHPCRSPGNLPRSAKPTPERSCATTRWPSSASRCLRRPRKDRAPMDWTPSRRSFRITR